MWLVLTAANKSQNNFDKLQSNLFNRESMITLWMNLHLVEHISSGCACTCIFLYLILNCIWPYQVNLKNCFLTIVQNIVYLNSDVNTTTKTFFHSYLPSVSCHLENLIKMHSLPMKKYYVNLWNPLNQLL